MQHSKVFTLHTLTIKLDKQECQALANLLEVARVSIDAKTAQEKFHETRQEEEERQAMLKVLHELFDILP